MTICPSCGLAFVPIRSTHRYCSHACASKATMHNRSLPAWRWWEDPDVVAWRENVVALIDEARAEPAEPTFFCACCGSRVPIADLIARRKLA